MDQLHIHQIFYSEKSRSRLDAGFIALDNMSNERPDWAEYWPIRKFLLSETLEPDAYYGFLSPNFALKTGLTSAQVKGHIEKFPGKDIYTFSPMWDLSAFFLNVFEQGDFFHPGLQSIAQEVCTALGYDIDLSKLIADSSTTVFCNYVVAKPVFWREWLAGCEKLFAMAEDPTHLLSAKLTATAPYVTDKAQMKVFIMERMAPLLLSLHKQYAIAAYSPFEIRGSTTRFSGFATEAVLSDALKTAMLAQNHADYMQTYLQIRQGVRGALSAQKR